MKPRTGLPALLAACVLASAGPGRADAAATTYALKDLGVAPVNDYQPWEPYYSAPQVNNAGVVSYALTGSTSAGGYSLKPAIGSFDLQYTGPGSTQALLYATPTLKNEPVLDLQTHAGGVNASGSAVGFSRGDNGLGTAGFEYHSGGPTGPGQQVAGLTLVPGIVPGTSAWFALGINASGTIVGQAPDSATTKLPAFGGFVSSGHAFVSDGTTSLDLNTLIAPGSGFLLTSATSINDLGQIAGFGYSPGGPYDGLHAFLLTPSATPEPGAWALALAGLGYLGLRRLRGRDLS